MILHDTYDHYLHMRCWSKFKASKPHLEPMVPWDSVRGGVFQSVERNPPKVFVAIKRWQIEKQCQRRISNRFSFQFTWKSKLRFFLFYWSWWLWFLVALSSESSWLYSDSHQRVAFCVSETSQTDPTKIIWSLLLKDDQNSPTQISALGCFHVLISWLAPVMWPSWQTSSSRHKTGCISYLEPRTPRTI